LDFESANGEFGLANWLFPLWFWLLFWLGCWSALPAWEHPVTKISTPKVKGIAIDFTK